MENEENTLSVYRTVRDTLRICGGRLAILPCNSFCGYS